MKPNQNFLLAMLLSFAIIWGWQYFYVQPHNEAYKKAHLAAMQQAPVLVKPISFTDSDRTSAINNHLRLKIDTAELSGSINLKGARFDDLSLKNYHEKVEKDSPQISLLSPEGTVNSYLADFGFKASNQANLDIPNQDSYWSVDSQNTILTPQHPVHLKYISKNGLVFNRTISVDSKFMFTIEDSVNNTSDNNISLQNYSRVARRDIPKNNKATYLLHEGPIGVFGNQGLKEKTYDSLKKLSYDEQGEKKLVYEPSIGGFVGITDKYWAVAAIPNQNNSFVGSFKYAEQQPEHYQTYLQENVVNIAPKQTINFTKRLFAGAKNVQTINAYQDHLHIKQFGLLIDWGMFSLITKPMFFLLDYLYKLTGNFGIAILLVTVLLKVILFPLAHKSYASMAKMRLLQPKLTEIKQRYGEDKVKLQQATIELYKKEKVNPAAGCLPLFIQMPIFFALYKVLYITIEMRHAPFFGWVKDLAAPDPTSIFNLFGLLPYHVPPFLMIGVWPILMGITMFLQMRLNPAPNDPVQARIFTWMPLVFTYALSAFPVGLVIYWAWNNLLTIVQQLIIMKKQNHHVS